VPTSGARNRSACERAHGHREHDRRSSRLYVKLHSPRERRERRDLFARPATRYVRLVTDVNHVSTSARSSASTRSARGGGVDGVRASAGEAGQPARPTASTAILRRRSSSAVRPRQPDELSGAALASFLHCAVDVPFGLLTSYVVSVVHRRRVAGAISTATSITYERRQSPATTARSQATCT
jgi:hypothetical protein